jgi:hypothetical protein
MTINKNQIDTTVTAITDSITIASQSVDFTGGITGDVLTVDGSGDWVPLAPSGGATIDDSAFGGSWDGDTSDGASKNALFDKIDAMDTTIAANTAKVSADGSITTHSDVNTSGAVGGNVLTFNGTSGDWEPSAAGSGDMIGANNLSDVVTPATALSNIGGEPVFSKNTGFNKSFGTGAGTVAEGNHTHPAADIISGTLAVARGGTNLGTYATGDIVYASSSGVLSKLGIGSSSQVLTVAGGIPSWAAAGAASLDDLTDTSFGSPLGNGEVLTFNGSVWTNSPAASGVTSGTITIPASGTLAGRLAAATGLPVGWSLVLGNDATSSWGAGGSGTGAATDVTLIHNETKVGLITLLWAAGSVNFTAAMASADSDVQQDGTFDQIMITSFNTKTSSQAAVLHVIFG